MKTPMIWSLSFLGSLSRLGFRVGCRFTGYADDGSTYCEKSDSKIDEAAHLLIYSGWAGVVVDAAMEDGNLIPYIGSVNSDDANVSSVYNSLQEASLTCSWNRTSSEVASSYTVEASGAFATVSLVRQGHTMTHITVTDLKWASESSGSLDSPVWVEVSVWANSVSLQLVWDQPDDDTYDDGDVNCTLLLEDTTWSKRAFFMDGSLTLLLTPNTANNGLELASYSSSLSGVTVAGSTGTAVISRDATADVLVEVPTSMSRCGYVSSCAPMPTVGLVVRNSNTEDEVVRLTISRNFPSWDNSYSTSRPSAEITGLSVVLRDINGHPTGIPLQISKNWHDEDTEPGYHGYWWTVNLILRVPAQTYFDGTFA